jgi:hypothetical protein
MAVVVEQVIAVVGEQREPGIRRRNEALLVVRRLRALVGHLEEKQIGKLLDVVAIARPVIA